MLELVALPDGRTRHAFTLECGLGGLLSGPGANEHGSEVKEALPGSGSEVLGSRMGNLWSDVCGRNSRAWQSSSFPSSD
eukprot:5530464-Pyramimonas_sp.AAC.1